MTENQSTPLLEDAENLLDEIPTPIQPPQIDDSSNDTSYSDPPADFEPVKLNFKQKFANPLKKLSRDDLEDLVLQKITEAVVYRSKCKDFRDESKTYKVAIEGFLERINLLEKMYYDLQMAHNRVMESIANNPTRPLVATKVIRSVGLQVMEEHKTLTNGVPQPIVIADSPERETKPKRGRKSNASVKRKLNGGNDGKATKKRKQNEVQKRRSGRNRNKSLDLSYDDDEIDDSLDSSVETQNTTVVERNSTKQTSTSSTQVSPIKKSLESFKTPMKKSVIEKSTEKSLNNDKTLVNGNNSSKQISNGEKSSKDIPSTSKSNENIQPSTSKQSTNPENTLKFSNLDKTHNSIQSTPIKVTNQSIDDTFLGNESLASNFFNENLPNISTSTPYKDVVKKSSDFAFKEPSPPLEMSKLPRFPSKGSKSTDTSGLKSPPAPKLKVLHANNGIKLTWWMDDFSSDEHMDIESYQIYAWEEKVDGEQMQEWKFIGDVKAMLLPMAVTLDKFQENQKFYFIVRGVDIEKRFGDFSAPKRWN